MKHTVGAFALALLLLAASVAIGQQSQFPMAANPSLEANTNGETVLFYQPHAGLPSSMAANAATSPPLADWRYEDWRYQVAKDNDSIFPVAANPSVGTLAEPGPLMEHHRINNESESPFPAAANPNSNW